MSNAIREGLSTLGDWFAALWGDIRELSWRGSRARQGTIAALSVAASTTLALLGHMDEPWWAAISGFMSLQATRPGSVQKATLRIIGTLGGAAVALALAPLLIYDHVAGSLFLLVAASVGMLGSLVSPHGYAWLFMSITANLIVLMSIGDPSSTLHFAGYRTMEVTLGTASALIVVSLLGSDDKPPPAPPPPGWRDPFGKNWPAVLHAVRTGIVVMLLPWVWSWFDLPGLSQMAVTVAAIMAVPALSGDPLKDGRTVTGRAVQRLLGCCLGGIIGLIALACSFEQFLPWLLTLMAGVWITANLQASTRGVGYIGTQAAIVFIMTLVQGWGPPSSILPGIDRFAGIFAGLLILLVVSLLLWPAQDDAAATARPA